MVHNWADLDPALQQRHLDNFAAEEGLDGEAYDEAQRQYELAQQVYELEQEERERHEEPGVLMQQQHLQGLPGSSGLHEISDVGALVASSQGKEGLVPAVYKWKPGMCPFCDAGDHPIRECCCWEGGKACGTRAKPRVDCESTFWCSIHCEDYTYCLADDTTRARINFGS
jgi:hypothetical protein